MTLDLKKYGFSADEASKMFTVTQIPAYEGQQVKQDTGIYFGDKVRIFRTIQPRDVVLLEIK